MAARHRTRRSRIPPSWRRLLDLLLFTSFIINATADSQDDDGYPALDFTEPLYHASTGENNVGKQYLRGNVRMGVPMLTNGSLPVRPDLRYKIVSGDPDNYFKAEHRWLGDFCFLLIRTRTNHRDVLNRERQSSFRLRIRAIDRARRRRDNVKRQSFTEVLVAIEDRNDLSPWFDAATYDVEVPEDLALHAVVTRLHADDADAGINGQVYYSLSETDGFFSIHPTSGDVILMRKLNYRRQAEFRVRAAARDRGLRRSDVPGLAQLRIKVRPVNLHDPIMQVNHVTEVVEHSHMNVYAIVRVSDDDEGVHGEIEGVRISAGDSDRLFRVLPGSSAGEFLVGLVGNLDRERAPFGYNLTLNATDRGVPSRSSSHSVRVRLMDFNDHAPSFTQEVYFAEVRETALPHTPVVQLRASDTDWGVNAELRYVITAGNADGKFTVNPRSGLISTIGLLDAEEKAFYALTVSALDQGYGSNRRQGSARVTINVLDENDNSPALEAKTIKVLVIENEPPGLLVVRVEAEDADQGDNSFLSFSIVNDESVPFAINHFDGTITTTEVLDYETQQRHYSLLVRVSDWGKPYRRQTEAVVIVAVANVNDNRPQFERVECHGFLAKEVSIGAELMVLSAVDWDEDSVIGYRIVSGNEDGCFALDERLGSLSVNRDLTQVEWKERRLGVMANDGEHFSLKSYIDLGLVKDTSELGGRSIKLRCRDTGATDKYRRVLTTSKLNNIPKPLSSEVRLEDEETGSSNEHDPDIINESFQLEVEESAEIGDHVTSVLARDKDLGFNGLLMFAISGGDADSSFRINMDHGNISVAGVLDRERVPLYKLNITVCDLGRHQRCASRGFAVHVRDINDNSPRFTKSSLVFYLSETREAGLNVVQLNASDPDDGLNGVVTYHMLTDTEDFLVNPSSGILYQTKPLDRERQSYYELLITARDGSPISPLEDQVHVHIDVLDVNDNPPLFSRLVYWTRAMEDLPVGTVLTSVDASDPDRPALVEPVVYTLIDGSFGHFSVDRHTGSIRLLQQLDFEHRQVFNLTVVAQDLDPPQLTATAYVVVLVVDVNENYHRPSFEVPVDSGSVAENRPPGTHVMTVKATDKDLPGPESDIIYSIRGGDGVGYFSVNQTGAISTRTVLDRETRSGYWLTVYATDSSAIALHSRLEVYISVLDENDNVPLAFETVYRCDVLENSMPGTEVVLVEASDLDRPLEPAHISFRITGGDPQALFNMDLSSGLITTSERRLDRESRDTYTLQVTVSDGGSPVLSSLVWVRVTVLDENDSTPMFSERFRRLEVPAGPVFSTKDVPIAQVIAYDADIRRNADVRYSIVDSDGPGFVIDELRGFIRVDSTVVGNDGLKPARKHEITVQAMDGGRPSRSSVTRLLLSLPADDVISVTPPLHPPLVTLPGDTVLVLETDPVGHLVALARTNSTVLFNIVDGNWNDRFAINEGGGVVVARPLDRETTDRYTLNVSSTDGHHVVYSMLSISIVDVNDCTPQFSSALYTADVSEGAEPGQLVATLRASDDDQLSTLYYDLQATQSRRSRDLFSVDPSSGQVRLMRPLDRETQDRHVLVVSVRDQGTPARRDHARVLVHVRDENDHAPRFSSDLVTGRVAETTASGSHVVTVLATDQDHGTNGLLQYSIESGNVGLSFGIDAALGSIHVANPLQRSSIGEYMLTVRASDSGQPSRHADIHVNILVTMPNNSPPRLQQTQYSAELLESVSVGQSILTVLASCQTAVSYRLLDGNHDDTFLFNPGSGVLSVNGRLDFEHRRTYNLTLQAVSTVGESARAHAIISVLDVNDNAPVFGNSTFYGSVSESARLGSPVLDAEGLPLVLAAYDPDSGPSGQLQYSIINDPMVHRFIDLDQATGAVRVASALDYETTPALELRVTVRDRGQPQLQAWRSAFLHVQVIDVDDEPPRFAHAQYNFSLLTPTYDGVVVGRVEAADPDSEHVRYTLTTAADGSSEATPGAVFVVDSSSGEIRVGSVATLHGSLPHARHLSVTASDGSHASSTDVTVQLRPLPAAGLSFSADVFYSAVPENQTVVETVVTLTVRGNRLNEPLHFSTLTHSPYFTVDSTSGVVRTTGVPLDRETRDHHVLVAEVRGHVADTDRLAHVLLNVSVADVNDNRPVFVGRPYHAIVAADAPSGSVVTKVKAVDADAGLNGQLSYSLSGGDSQLFTVDRRTGLITWSHGAVARAVQKSNMAPDAAAARVYTLTVSARDHGNSPLMSEAEVLVSVVHGSQPRFLRGRHQTSVRESAPAGTPLLTVEAAAPAHYTASSGVVYLLSSAVQQGDGEESRPERPPFDVDFTSGVVHVTGALDYERQRRYLLNVTALDRVTASSASVPVTVDVINVNDNTPRLHRQRYNVTVSEAALPGVRLMRIGASDADGDLHERLRYELRELDGSEAQHVRVDRDGWLQLTGYLDREARAVHQLLVTVADDGTPPLNSSAPLLLYVDDVNDNGPVFERVVYRCRLTDRPSREQLVTMVTAHDADAVAQLRYRLVGGNQRQHFSINPDNGVISVANTRHFDAARLYKLNVSVTDGVFASYVDVIVHLIPTNQHAPEFESATYMADLYENAAVGTAVVQVTASDPDPGHLGQVTYSIPCPHWSRTFAVNSTSGLVAVRGGVPLDRELQPVVELVLWAVDGGNRSTQCSVRLVLLDVNDHPPQFQLSQYRVTVPANLSAGDVVAQVEAIDLDEGRNSEVTYSIFESNSSDIKQAFDINPRTGEVILMSHAAQLVSSVYQFFVRAVDGGSPRLSADVPVDVLVLQDSAGLPRFESHSAPADVYLSESESPGAVIGTVRARVDHGDIYYSIVSDHNRPEAGMFGVGEDGRVTLLNPLDREQVDSYSITVAAVTDSLPPLVVYQRLRLHVLDSNDNPPVFDAAIYHCSTVENLPPGTKLVQVIARDADAGGNGRVRYRLSVEPDTAGDTAGDNVGDSYRRLSSVLAVDEWSGWVSSLVPLDRELLSVYQLVVHAIDSGSPSRTSSAVVRVRVDDVNDSPPLFGQLQYESVVSEDAPPRTSILTLDTIDKDSILTLDSINKDSILTLDSTNKDSILTLDSSDRDSIRTLNSNDMDSILTLNSSDTNLLWHGAVEPLSFYITDGDPAHQFQVLTAPSGVGELLVRSPLDRESVPYYQLSISATDGSMVASTLVLVDVLDANDEWPVCSESLYTCTLSENAPAQYLLTVAASDKDSPRHAVFRYSLSGPGAEHFQIHPQLGHVSVVESLDREIQSEYRLAVYAADPTRPERRCSSQLHVTVTDVNDTPPRLRLAQLALTVPEDAEVGRILGRLLADDDDLGESSVVKFDFPHQSDVLLADAGSREDVLLADAGSREDVLLADADSREDVLLADAGSREDVLLTDAGSREDVLLTDVDSREDVLLTDADSREDVLLTDADSREDVLLTDAEPGEAVLADADPREAVLADADTVENVLADADTGENVLLIDADTGVISLAAPLDRERKASYNISVRATDRGVPPLSIVGFIQLTVQDVNDNPPEFTESVYSGRVPENATVGARVTRVMAGSRDTGVNAQVSYRIVGGDEDGVFLLNPTSGEMFNMYKSMRENRVQRESSAIGHDHFTNQELKASGWLLNADQSPQQRDRVGGHAVFSKPWFLARRRRTVNPNSRRASAHQDNLLTIPVNTRARSRSMPFSVENDSTSVVDDVVRSDGELPLATCNLPHATSTQRRSQMARHAATSLCRQYLQDSDKYELIQPLNDLGYRSNKHWFLVKDLEVRTERLMTITSVRHMPKFLQTPNATMVLRERLTRAKHPYLFPVLDVDIIHLPDQRPAVVIIVPFNTSGSLRDIIHKTPWDDHWRDKYSTVVSERMQLPLPQIRRLALQLVEALLHLRRTEVTDTFQHLHSGNVIVQNGVARLTGLEASLLEYPVICSHHLHPPQAQDVISVGRLIFEMATGHPPAAEIPSPLEMELLNSDVSRELTPVLELIFNSPGQRVPALEIIPHLHFFQRVQLRELVRRPPSLSDMHLAYISTEPVKRLLPEQTVRRKRSSSMPGNYEELQQLRLDYGLHSEQTFQ